jgi:GT2 family glycosyltransferase
MATAYPTSSVVIPTFNRLGDLRRVVGSVDGQHQPDGARLELVVVDDGSTDGTWEWLEEQQGHGRLIALHQDNSGPARARNRGAESASGEVVLFLGDDTVPEPGWLLAHLEEHRLFGGEDPIAVLGYTSFPSTGDTPFRRFINEFGAQFGYQLIDRPLSVPFNFLYTSNISLPRELMLGLGGFREDFPAAAWEDIEFAYRAVAGGLRIRYQPRARAVHHHRIRSRTFCRRQRTSGRSAAIFARLHPDLKGFLGVDRLQSMPPAPRLYGALLGLLVVLGERVPLPIPHGVYQRYLDISYLQGLAEGLHEGSGEVQHANHGMPPGDLDPGGGGATGGVV